MNGVIQNISDSLRKTGWRQGCIIDSCYAANIIENSIDYVDEIQNDFWFVIITQDCDVVRCVNEEPYLELLALEKLQKPPTDKHRGKSSRYLHLTVSSENHWFKCTIHHRFRVKKEFFHSINFQYELLDDEKIILRKWVGKRYTRPGFPDRFETIFNSTNKPAKNILRSKGAKLVSCIYICIENENATDAEDYRIKYILSYPSEINDDEDLLQSVQGFDQQLDDFFSNLVGIEYLDGRFMSERDITLEILRNYKRYDVDYRSVDDESAVNSPD